MSNVDTLKNAMSQQIKMLDDIENLINSNRDVLTEDELSVVITYLDSVRSPWSVILAICDKVAEKQKAKKEAAKDTTNVEDKPKATEAKSKKGNSEPAEPAEEVNNEEDWDFLGEED